MSTPDAGRTTPAALHPARLLEEGRAFCMAPWTHLAVNTEGEVLPCCEATGGFGTLREEGIEAIWQGEAMQAFRARLRADQPDPRCVKCYAIEGSGGFSYRRSLNRQFAAHAGRAVQPGAVPLPISLDIRFSNLCNLACRMCWHGSSSRWFADAQALGLAKGPKPLIAAFPDVESGLAALRPLLPTIRSIYWAGGEPLMAEEHYRVLEELIALGRTDVDLIYTTNATTLRLGRRDAIGLWSHFGSITVECSIDAAGARGELIRHGLTWERFAATTAEILDRCPQASLKFGITVSVLNVAAIDELYHAIERLMNGRAFGVRIHPVQDPRHLDIRILPRRMKQVFGARLLALATATDGKGATAPGGMTAAEQLRSLVDYMHAADESWWLADFRDATLALDRLRGQDTAAVCPELAPLLLRNPLPYWRRGVRGGVRLLRRLARALPRRQKAPAATE
jgi:radical SAM protein with 4Fe4S-binding SPASM domain